MAFCDFCNCDDCVNGSPYLYHAETTDGRWICDVCWLYDQCTTDKNGFGVPRNRNGPCEDPECPHRPKLRIPRPEGWVKYEAPKTEGEPRKIPESPLLGEEVSPGVYSATIDGLYEPPTPDAPAHISTLPDPTKRD